MFILYLYENQECIAQIEDIFELNCDLKLNGASQVKLTLDASSPYIRKDLLRMWRPLRITELIDGVEYEVLSWVIRGVEANFTEVEIIAESWRVLLEKRLTTGAKKRTNSPLETVVQELFADQNQKAPLPFSVECESGSTVSLEVGEKAVFSSVLNSLVREWVDILLIGDTLKIGKKIWRNRTDWPLYKDFRYDTTEPEGNTIDKAKLIIDAKGISNSVGSNKDDSSIAVFGLLEETKSNEDEQSYLNEHKDQVSEFSISVSDDFFYDVELGDQVQVYINGYNELMQYDGAMKIVGKRYKSWDMPTIEYTVSSKRIPQEGFFGTLQKLSEKVQQGGKVVIKESSSSASVDLSWYATSSAVAQALQSQNAKTETKASQSFVEGVAQAVQTALNTANQKAPLHHTHTKNEVWLWAVDNTSDQDKPLSRATREALEFKSNISDIMDTLSSEEVTKPLSARQGKVLKGLIDNLNTLLVSDDADLDQLQEIVNYIKQNKTTLDQLGISNIAGLQNALNNKANKVHTHTKSQITDFPTSMPASDVYARAKAATKPSYNWNEIQLKPATFTPAPHHHYIEVNVTTAWNQQHKVGTTDQGHYIPKKGDRFLVNFVHWTVIARPTLNIDGSGAKSIRAGYYDVSTNMLNLNRTPNSNIKVFLWYDGSHYQMFWAGHNNTYGEIPEAEIGDPSKTHWRTISGRRIAKIKEYFERHVPTPTGNTHAANKQYVDELISGINTTLQSLGQTQQRILTKAQWKALSQKDANTIYFVKGVWIYIGTEKIIANNTPWFKMMH